MLDRMGLGPWYRLGLSMSNAVLLAAIVETIVTCNAASHLLAYTLAEYHYGLFGQEPSNLATDIREHPEWALLGVVLILQILVNAMFWVAVIIKGNKHFAILWVKSTFVKTLYTALLNIMHDWDQTYDGLVALQRIFSFLWGTVLFGFCVVTGIQTYFHLSSEEGRVKLSPVGQGLLAIRDYYRETPLQLAVVLLLSEIITTIHRYFHYPKTAYLEEASFNLGYPAPDEWGEHISTATVVINAFGLILLAFKNSGAQKGWMTVYVILILVHFILLIYIVIDWSPVNIHPHMFNGFVFVSIVHLVYKCGILYIYLKTIQNS